MKFTLFVLFVSLLVSCKKEKDDGLRNYLQGKWELSFKRGPNFDQYLPAGNGNLLQFSASSFFRSSPNRQTQTGTYILRPDSSFNSQGTKITFIANDTVYSRFLITNDTAIVFFEYGSSGELNLYKRWK